MKFNQTVGIGIMLAAVVLFILGFAYARAAEQALLEGHEVGPSGECTHDDGRSCPFVQLNTLASLKYAGLFADIALFAFGLVLFLKRSPEEKAVSKARKAARGLGSEESTVFDLVTKADGMIFQNELVEKTGLSKVKVTRVLDKLEAKGLIERRRRGMTNAVILK